MNKKEISEIKKQFTPERNVISRICGCYIDGEKNIKFSSREAFFSLPEEDVHKYCDIFKKSMSGTLGKNLINMEFPLDSEMEGGTQEFLMKLRETKLKDDDLVNEFYQKVIDNYEIAGNYYIILIHSVYDIPGRASDGLDMEDASDEVYEFLLCSICPVNLSKACLSYNAEKNSIEDRIRDWIVDAPANAFLFPVFNDRSTDIHSVLYYSKNPEQLQPGLVENVLGASVPMTAETQKDSFNSIISDTIGEDCSLENIKMIHETLNEMISESKDNPEPLVLTKKGVKDIIENSGIPNDKIDDFEKEFEAIVDDDTTFMATNVANVRKFNIETPDVVIKVNPDRTDLIESRMIDGKECLVITVNDRIEVNGINVRTMSNIEFDN